MVQNSEQFIKFSLIYTFQKLVAPKFNDNENIKVKHKQHFTIVSRTTSVGLHRKFLFIVASKNLDKTNLSPLDAFPQ